MSSNTTTTYFAQVKKGSKTIIVSTIAKSCKEARKILQSAYQDRNIIKVKRDRSVYDVQY